MILTTTNSIDGFSIAEYKGIVSGTAVNMQKMKINLMEIYHHLDKAVMPHHHLEIQ